MQKVNSTMAMKFVLPLIVLIPLTATLSCLQEHPDDARAGDQSADEWTQNWPQWRGPNMDGVAPHGNPPLTWSETENIAWKVAIPGLGASTPVIWGDLIFLQTAIPVGDEVDSRQKLQDWQADGTTIFQNQHYTSARKKQRFEVVAIDRRTGVVRWRRAVHEELPHEGIHPTNTWASASPVTDGKHVLAFFGSAGLTMLTMTGEIVWQKDLGDMQTRNGWGEGSSPAMFGDKVVVNWDHEGDSFIVALDKTSGEELWRQPRDEVTSWFTPLVVPYEGRNEVVTTGASHVRGYDLESGELLWQGPGLTVNAIPTPVTRDDMVYVTSGYRGNVFLAISMAKASGDLESADAIAWRYDRDTPYVATPLLYHDQIYFTKQLKGILTSIDRHTGEAVYGPVRLDAMKMIYASPVAAAGRIYLVSRGGVTTVIADGPEFKTLAVNRLDDEFDASPAIVDNALFLRGKEYLYKIVAE